MEKSLQLKAEVRTSTGSKGSARLRRQGRIPAIVYGHQKTPESISLDAHDFVEGLHHGHRLMDIQIGSKTETLLVKDVQYDYLGRDIIHADLIRVNVSERVRVSVAIELKGTAKGSSEGGMIEEHAAHIEVECLVTNIPESLPVSIKDVGVGDALHAGDVAMPEGVTLMSPAETLLVTCHMKAAAKSTEELEEEEPSAPEVITEKKDAEEATEG